MFSHNAPVTPNGYNEEEMKLVKETRKIWVTFLFNSMFLVGKLDLYMFGVCNSLYKDVFHYMMQNNNDVKVTATCIRVPVMRAHAESVNLQFETPLDEV